MGDTRRDLPLSDSSSCSLDSVSTCSLGTTWPMKWDLVIPSSWLAGWPVCPPRGMKTLRHVVGEYPAIFLQQKVEFSSGKITQWCLWAPNSHLQCHSFYTEYNGEDKTAFSSLEPIVGKGQVFLQHLVCPVFWQINYFRMSGILGIGDSSLGYGYFSATRWKLESVGFSHNFERL